MMEKRIAAIAAILFLYQVSPKPKIFFTNNWSHIAHIIFLKSLMIIQIQINDLYNVNFILHYAACPEEHDVSFSGLNLLHLQDME